MTLNSVKFCLLCPELSRASDIVDVPVFAGEGVGGLKLGTLMDCYSRTNVFLLLQVWDEEGPQTCLDGCRPQLHCAGCSSSYLDV